MFQTSEGVLKSVALHAVGNKLLDEKLTLTNSLVKPQSENLFSEVKLGLFEPFSTKQVFFQFSDPINLELNKVYSIVKNIFNSPSHFLSYSKQIATHLYQCSDHHMIKGGDVLVAYFRNCLIDDVQTDAVGIYKIEAKQQLINSSIFNESSILEIHEGIDIGKIDKCCIIFNTDEREGYKVCLTGSLNKSVEVKYWIENFLSIMPCKDEYHKTNNFLHLAKDFISNQIEASQTPIDKTQAIDYLNKTVDYFKNNNHFIEKDFTSKVFSDKELTKSFQTFKDNYTLDKSYEISDEFLISPEATKKTARIFKNVLKLDKNFHVYIHGNTELIEKGFDPQTGKYYYKIYFDEET